MKFWNGKKIRQWFSGIKLQTKIALVGLCGVIAVGVFLINDQPTIKEKLSLTYLDSLSLQDLNSELETSFDQKYEISDYMIYGETLTLLQNAYDPLNNDDLYGKGVLLVNIETGANITTTFSGGADGGIDLGTLPQGVYEVYVYDGYTPKRVYMSEEFHMDPFITVRNNKTVSSINMDADSEYLEKFSVSTDEDYLFLTVTETLPKVKITDVVLDPSGLYPTWDDTIDVGWSNEILTEKDASWNLAMRIQELLEEKGLRCTISRGEDETVGYSGSDGRAARGYDAQAKLFVSLQMDSGDESRPFLEASPFSNGNLANQIAIAMAANGVELADVSTSIQLNPGVTFDDYWIDDSYNYTGWSLQPALRETGGKATSAGTASGWSANEMFSQAIGMNSVILFYASDENTDSQTYFLEHQEAMAQAVVQGIMDYCSIEEGETE